MKRAVQRELETTLAKALLRGDFAEEDTIVVEVAKGGDGASGGLRLRKGVPAGGAIEPMMGRRWEEEGVLGVVGEGGGGDRGEGGRCAGHGVAAGGASRQFDQKGIT